MSKVEATVLMMMGRGVPLARIAKMLRVSIPELEELLARIARRLRYQQNPDGLLMLWNDLKTGWPGAVIHGASGMSGFLRGVNILMGKG
jgi:hypothetical protein